MSNFRNWISAFRLRTLPLSFSGIIFGSFIAKLNGFWDTIIFVLALLTTLLFQVLSNLANDLGDSLKGTDNEHRVGPERAVQSGKISINQMKRAVIITSILALISAFILIYFGTKNLTKEGLFFYVFLALACVLAAITYTIGKKAYGYHGMGDVFVFIFFGFVSILGVYTLISKEIEWMNCLPAIAFGCLSTAVLNLNNMRDRINDATSNKKTLVVMLGKEKAKIYHLLLISAGFIPLVIFYYLSGNYILFCSLLPFAILIKHVIKVFKTQDEKEFDPELKKVALSTFMIAVLFMILVFTIS